MQKIQDRRKKVEEYKYGPLHLRQHLPVCLGAAGIPHLHGGTGHLKKAGGEGRGDASDLYPPCECGSVANLYPFNYSGKTDPHGFYVGRDKFGSNVLVDFNQRAEDKTNGSILILGNSGQGKSYLLKLILCNLRESGMNVICLDPEMEYEDLTNNLQGCFIDLMGGRYIINLLEPKVWDEGDGPEDPDAPETFRISSRLSQHISFLKDFFRSYKDFTDREIDVIEILLQKLYQSRGLSDQTDFQRLEPEDYPTLAEMYDFIEAEYKGFDEKKRQLYTADLLQNILLGLHSMCKGRSPSASTGIPTSRIPPLSLSG